MPNLYLWIKVGHIVSVVAWMAAMFYLPRLFVYHAGATVGSELSETLKTMERRLARAIMTPAMLATWAFGVALAIQGEWWRAGWLHGKLALVVALSGLHGYLLGQMKRFAADRREKDARFYRIVNEVPTVLLVLIVVLVVVKPF